MADHDHRCPQCMTEQTTSHLDAECPICGTQMNILGSAGVSNFKTFWHPNLNHNPVFISSAKALDKACQDNGAYIKESPLREKYIRLPQSEKEARDAF